MSHWCQTKKSKVFLNIGVRHDALVPDMNLTTVPVMIHWCQTWRDGVRHKSCWVYNGDRHGAKMLKINH